MSQTYVNGPAELHVGTSGQPSPNDLEFLGWSESGVRISFDGGFEDVPSDRAGSRMPFDVQYMGMQAFISADVNLYNEGIYRKITGRANITGSDGSETGIAAAEGRTHRYSIGFLMNQERSAGASGMFRFLVVGPYGRGVANKPAFATQDTCYNFYNAYLADAVDMELGSRYKRIRMTFRAITVIDPSYDGQLYDHNITGRAALN